MPIEFAFSSTVWKKASDWVALIVVTIFRVVISRLAVRRQSFSTPKKSSTYFMQVWGLSIQFGGRFAASDLRTIELDREKIGIWLTVLDTLLKGILRGWKSSKSSLVSSISVRSSEMFGSKIEAFLDGLDVANTS